MTLCYNNAASSFFHNFIVWRKMTIALMELSGICALFINLTGEEQQPKGLNAESNNLFPFRLIHDHHLLLQVGSGHSTRFLDFHSFFAVSPLLLFSPHCSTNYVLRDKSPRQIGTKTLIAFCNAVKRSTFWKPVNLFLCDDQVSFA